MSEITCKELISIFEKIGGKLICKYDTKTCTLLSNKISCKIKSDNRVDIDMLLFSISSSGNFDYYVNILPESEENKKNIIMQNTIHNYQEKNSSGFVIKFNIDK
jgi:hypothetical protein